MAESKLTTRIEVLYSGHVQVVGFRYTTARLAGRFPVVGYVQNLSDGRVRLMLEGAEADIQNLLSDVADAMDGHIRDAEIARHAATGEFGDFGIRH